MLTFVGEKKKCIFPGCKYLWRIHEKVLSQISFSNLKLSMISVMSEYEALIGNVCSKATF